MGKLKAAGTSAYTGIKSIITAHPYITAAAAITLMVSAMVKFSNAAKDASKEADELKEKRISEAEAAREEKETLSELINKYKELANSETQDSTTREEIKKIQSDITDLVGAQADNLDLVNGKLDDELEKLHEIEKSKAEDALNSSISAYHTANDSENKAVGSQTGSFAHPALGSWDYVGARDKDAEEILYNADSINKNYIRYGGWAGNTTIASVQYLLTDENGDGVIDISDKIERLNSWIDALKSDGKYDYASSDFFNAIVAQRDAYQKYVDDTTREAYKLLNNQIIYSTYNSDLLGMNVKSLEDYENYRNKLIELVKNNPNLSEALNNRDLTESDVVKQVDSYLGTIPGYSEFYNKFSENEKLKKKIQTVRSDFYNSNVRRYGENAAKNKLIEFDEWFNTLSEADKLAVYDIDCNTDTATWNLEDWQNALAETNKYTTQSLTEIKENYDSAAESTETLADGISSVQDVLSSQSTGKSISIDDFNSDELKDYTSALEYNNGVLQLNAEKVREIVEAKSDEQIETNNTNKAMAQSQYLENAAQIEKYRKELKESTDLTDEQRDSIQNNIDALLEENSAIKLTCDSYDIMTSSLEEATNAYNNWLNAQKASQSGDMFDDTLDAINRINETLNDTDSEYFGRVGRTDYTAALELIIPDTIDQEDSEKVNAYLKSVYDLFTYDDDGNYSGLNIANFCQKAVDAGLMVIDESGENYQIAGSKTMEDFAEGLNLSLPLVQAMFGEMEEFGGEFSWADEANKTIGDLAVSANVAAENLRGLHSDMTITLDVSDLTTAKEKSDALDSTIKQMQDLKATVGVDAEEVEYANSIIAYCITQKQQLSEPAILDVDTTKVSETTSEAVSLVQEFQRACNDLELKQALRLDTTEAQAKVDELYSQISSSDNDALLALKLDTTSVETVKSSIAELKIDGIKANLQIDDTALLSYQSEDKQVTVIYDIDTTRVDNYNPENLSRTVTYYVRTVGSVKANGTANLTGTAKASGDWGTAQGGKTLTGELGREIVVDPHTGRWYTVGDTGAEFVNIPRGAIVFNHKQSESLLKNGYVAGRASALVGGTAMVTGGISVGNANNSTTSGGNSTSNYSNNNSSSSDDDKIEAFDWIEIAINRIERAIDRLKKTAESTYKALKTKLGATADEITKVNQEIALQQQAYDRYMQEANSVGLDADLAAKVRDGSIDISQYDEDTRQLIEDYQDWYIFMPLYTAMYIEEFI